MNSYVLFWVHDWVPHGLGVGGRALPYRRANGNAWCDTVGFLNPTCYGVPSRGPPSMSHLSRFIFGRGGAENAANNEPKRGFIRTPRYEPSPLVSKLYTSNTSM